MYFRYSIRYIGCVESYGETIMFGKCDMLLPLWVSVSNFCCFCFCFQNLHIVAIKLELRYRASYESASTIRLPLVVLSLLVERFLSFKTIVLGLKWRTSRDIFLGNARVLVTHMILS